MDHERTNTRAARRQASAPISAAPRPTKTSTTARREAFPVALPAEALDDRIAIVGTAGSGKTYAAKGFVERLLDSGAHVTIVDPLGVWWGLRASADGAAPGYPIVVFGGRHADVPIAAETGAALGRMIAREALVSIADLSELGSNAARRRFMAAFSEALYEANEEPLHLILDEADLWAPQRPLPDQTGLLGHIEEIVRRGRVRGFIPWLITQRPAVVHKDVLSQADILIAMKLTASQDRDAVGAWIEGQADRQEGKRILGELPRLQRGEGYLWAPGRGILDRVAFPPIRTFDSSRTPKRGERLAAPRTLAEVDLTAIVAALAAAENANRGEAEGPASSPATGRRSPPIGPARTGAGGGQGAHRRPRTGKPRTHLPPQRHRGTGHPLDRDRPIAQPHHSRRQTPPPRIAPQPAPPSAAGDFRRCRCVCIRPPASC